MLAVIFNIRVGSCVRESESEGKAKVFFVKMSRCGYKEVETKEGARKRKAVCKDYGRRL